MRSPLRLLPLALVVVLVVSSCGSGRPPAAVVDGETITDAHLRDQMELFSFLGSLSQQPCGQAQTSIGETPDSACARFTLSNLIQEDLVKHYATAHGISVAESEVTDIVSRLETSLGGPERLQQRLKANGLTRPQLVALARRLLLFSEAQRAIVADEVTQAQLRDLYEQQRQQFTQIHAKHILVKSRSLAQRIANEATVKTFGELARRYSTDSQSASNGGDLGTLDASSLDPDFVRAALALAPGQISGPVHTQFGWHVILLVSVDVKPFEEVKDQLSASLQSQAFASWMQDRLSSAEILVNPRYGRLDLTTGEVLPIRSTETVASASSTPTAPAATPSA